MKYDNITLWFAKDESDNIITIDEVDSKNKAKYFCPMCSSELIPKATKNNAKVTPHFAHIDKSKCNSETMIHWWFKNKFISQNDKFIIKTDGNQEFICKDLIIEKTFVVGGRTYRPDITIVTTTGETVHFEMNYANKKKIEDYIDIWLELKNIIVEIDIKQLMNCSIDSDVLEFKALFYDGKCFNIKKNDFYYNTIGIYKERLLSSEYSEEIKNRVKKLDWFWTDVARYNKREVDIDHMTDLIQCVDEKDMSVLISILRTPKCNRLYDDYNECIRKRRNVILNNVNLTKAINMLNDKYINIDSNYKISLCDTVNNITVTLYYRCEIILKLYISYDMIVKSKECIHIFNYLDQEICNYRSSIIPLCITDYLLLLTEDLRNEYSGLGLSISGNKISEDIFKIFISGRNFAGNYDISNISVIEKGVNDKLLLNIDDMCKIKEVIIKNFNDKVKEFGKKVCISCGNRFNINIDAMRFFIKNNMKLPKRCKKCRDIRKKVVNIIDK